MVRSLTRYAGNDSGTFVSRDGQWGKRIADVYMECKGRLQLKANQVLNSELNQASRFLRDPRVLLISKIKSCSLCMNGDYSVSLISKAPYFTIRGNPCTCLPIHGLGSQKLLRRETLFCPSNTLILGGKGCSTSILMTTVSTPQVFHCKDQSR